MRLTLRMTLAAAGLFAVSGPVAAQELRFGSVAEAIDQLIFGGGDAIDCGPLLDEDGDPMGIVGALREVCDFGNVSAGSSLSGSFASPLPTRSFVPLTFGPSRTARRTGTTRVSSRGTASALGAPDRLTLGVGLSGARENREQSEFGPRFEQDTALSSLSAAYAVSPAVTLGVSFGAGRIDGRGPGVTLENPLDPGNGADIAQTGYSGAELSRAVNALQDVCDRLGGRDTDGGEVGLRATASFGAPWARQGLALSVGTVRREIDYGYTSCFYVLPDFGPGEYYASRISGAQKTTEYDIAASYWLGFAVGASELRPHGGIAYSRTVIDERTERGSASGESIFVGDLGLRTEILDGTPQSVEVLPSGLELAYDDASFDSIRSRLGLTWIRPVGASDRGGVIFADATHVREFGDDTRRVTARFAGDARDAPTPFSFETEIVDTSYVELSVGAQVTLGRHGAIQARATRLVDYEGRNDWSAGFSFVVAF